jgi:hypothetical protein
MGEKFIPAAKACAGVVVINFTDKCLRQRKVPLF